MMKLGTMTIMLMDKNKEDREAYIKSMRRTKEYGFEVMDLCMCPVQRDEVELCLDDEWEAIAYSIRNESEKLGLPIVQSHLPYPTRRASKDAYGPEAELNDRFRELVRRCIRVSEICGVKWAVAHPVFDSEGLPHSFDDCMKFNHKVYDEFVELAAKSGVGIAFENMCDNAPGARRFAVTADELCAFVDSYNAPDQVGVCWDFGHANRTYPGDQSAALRYLGKRLRATHVDDNVGKDDLHMAPYDGTVKWNNLMPILAEIGYEGPFIYEINVRATDPVIRDAKIKYLKMVGDHLISLAK